MVKAGHMDAIDEIFLERRMKAAVIAATPSRAKEQEEPEEDIWELTGGVVLGMVCIAIFTFLAAAC